LLVGLIGSPDGINIEIVDVEGFPVISCHLGRTIDDGNTVIIKLGLQQGFKYNLVTDAVDISMGDPHSYL
jgi:hypothetical protein